MECCICHRENPEKAKFCMYCGNKIVYTNACKNRGSNSLPVERLSCVDYEDSLNKKSKEMTTIDFDRIGNFSEKSAVVVKNKKSGLIIIDDEYQIRLFLECNYEHVLPFSEGRCAIQENGRWSFLDRSGQKVLKLDEKYDVSSDIGYICGLCKVLKADDDNNLHYGFIDKSGREVIQCKYDWVTDFDRQTNLAVVRIEEGEDGYQEEFLIDKYGNQQSDKAYNVSLYDGVIVSDISRKEKLIKSIKTGKQIFLKNASIINVHNEVCSYIVDGKLVCFNISNPNVRKSFKGKVWMIDSSSDNRIGVELENPNINTKDGNAGYINTECTIAIPFSFRRVSCFNDGLAAVIPNGKDKWGFIDINGNLIIDCVYDEYASFHDGFASVVKKGKWTIIDRMGNELF